ncbi:MAG TPA: response regulator [Polyangiaceae bacterium]|jgi:CheY-like chemotaxis protein
MGEDAKRKKLVLVVDDDAAVRTMICKALLTQGYDVQQAADGLAASEVLGQGRTPDLLICDVMMPTIDGFSLARMVKNRKELRAMPIIFLTAKAQPADLMAGIALGARHYVTKPFSIKDLLDKVEKTLR